MSRPLYFGDARFNNTDIIVPDTNFWLSHVGFNKDKNRQSECAELVYNATANQALFALNIKSQEEIVNVVVRERLKEQGLNTNRSIKTFRLEFPKKFVEINSSATQEAIEYIDAILNTPGIYNEPVGVINDELNKKALSYMSMYGLQLSDAQILAISLKEEASYLATCDQDFINVNESGIKILLDFNTFRKI